MITANLATAAHGACLAAPLLPQKRLSFYVNKFLAMSQAELVKFNGSFAAVMAAKVVAIWRKRGLLEYLQAHSQNGLDRTCRQALLLCEPVVQAR